MIGCREREVRDRCLKSYGVFFISNVWWDHIPDANCSGVKGENTAVWMRQLVAMYWPRFFNGFNRPGGGVMLIILFSILYTVMACLIIDITLIASRESRRLEFRKGRDIA